MTISKRDGDCIIWQNRVFGFTSLLAIVFHKGFYPTTAFLAQQCTEQLMKATLKWVDPSFEPRNVGHDLKKMSRTIQEKVPFRGNFMVPEYLCDGKYQSLSRYPAPDGQGYGVPGTLVSDVDCLFVDLVEMVPFLFNSELSHTLEKERRHEHWLAELGLNNE